MTVTTSPTRGQAGLRGFLEKGGFWRLALVVAFGLLQGKVAAVR